MPYIKQEDREKFALGLSEIQDNYIANPGELNYLLTQICLIYQYHRDNGNYQMFNDIVGALECCKLELYRRKIGIYEDLKIKENGDVY